MDSTIKYGRNPKKAIKDLVNIKGKIFSLIKDGYEFADDVLEAAHITKTVQNTEFLCSVRKNINNDKNSCLKKDTRSTRQIISDLSAVNRVCNDSDEDNRIPTSSYTNQIDEMTFDKSDD